MDGLIAPNRHKKEFYMRILRSQGRGSPGRSLGSASISGRILPSALRAAGTQVEGLTRLENVIVFACVFFAVVDQNFAVHGFEGVAVDKDGGALIDADTKQVRMSCDDRVQIVLAMANNDVLVNGGAGQQSEAGFMSGDHHEGVVSVRIAG